MFIVVVKDKGLRQLLLLLRRERELFGTELNRHDCIGDGAGVIVPGLDHQAQRLVFNVHEFVGKVERGMEADERAAFGVRKELFQMLDGLVAALCELDLFSEIVEVFAVSGNDEAADAVRQEVGASLHIRGGKLGSDVIIACLFHALIGAGHAGVCREQSECREQGKDDGKDRSGLKLDAAGMLRDIPDIAGQRGLCLGLFLLRLKLFIRLPGLFLLAELVHPRLKDALVGVGPLPGVIRRSSFRAAGRCFCQCRAVRAGTCRCCCRSRFRSFFRDALFGSGVVLLLKLQDEGLEFLGRDRF